MLNNLNICSMQMSHLQLRYIYSPKVVCSLLGLSSVYICWNVGSVHFTRIYPTYVSALILKSLTLIKSSKDCMHADLLTSLVCHVNV